MTELLSLTGRRWHLRTNAGSSPVESVDELIAMLLLQRGIGMEAATPGRDGTYFIDFDKAYQRVKSAIIAGEKVGIFGDYDCDGITATAIMTRFFRRHGLQPWIRLPHRLTEGYGLRVTHIDEMIKEGVTLLVTVDTGVTALEHIHRAKKHGIETIILDHHTLPSVLPPAVAILHPRLWEGPEDSDTCGAGVAWSFVRAYERKTGSQSWEDCGTDAALAAIGTVADIMELRGGNRTLVQAGLCVLNEIKEGPLALLRMQAGITGETTAGDIGFRLAPRINAAGRMADPHIALQALLGDATALLSLEQLNEQRQDAVLKVLRIYEEHDALFDPFICVLEETLTPGVCGLIAGKLCDRTGRPVLAAARQGDTCVASLRSVPGYDVTALLHRIRHLLIDFGGHAMAAGCTFAASQFSDVRDACIADFSRAFPQGTPLRSSPYDAIIDIRHITPEFCEGLKLLEPCGNGNPQPIFLLQNACLTEARMVGADKKHLQARLRRFPVIGFHHAPLLEYCGKPMDILCRIGLREWRGNRDIQITLEDARILVPNTKTSVAVSA